MNLSIFYSSTALFLTRKCCTYGWPISAAPSRKLDTFAEGLVAVAAAGVVYVSCWTGSGRWGCIGARHTDYCAQVDAGQLCFHLWGEHHQLLARANAIVNRNAAALRLGITRENRDAGELARITIPVG